MVAEPDPRLLKAIRDLDRERQLREKAEKQATALRGVITRLQRTVDAVTKKEPRAEC